MVGLLAPPQPKTRRANTKVTKEQKRSRSSRCCNFVFTDFLRDLRFQTSCPSCSLVGCFFEVYTLNNGIDSGAEHRFPEGYSSGNLRKSDYCRVQPDDWRRSVR